MITTLIRMQGLPVILNRQTRYVQINYNSWHSFMSTAVCFLLTAAQISNCGSRVRSHFLMIDSINLR